MSEYYEIAAASERRIDAILAAYAPQVVEAMNARGYPAYLEVIAGTQTPYGYQTANHYLIHVPGSPGRETGVSEYRYLVNEGVTKSHGNPGNTAAYIISDIMLLIGGAFTVSQEELDRTTNLQQSEWDATHPVGTPSNPLIVPVLSDLPTGSGYYKEEESEPSGQSGTTAPVSTSSESTPSSGTIPTEPAKSGLLYELSSVAQANGFDPAGTYNGYEIGWFYSRTPSSSGYDIGPSELGIGQDEKITLLTAAGKIVSYLAGGGPSQQQAPGGSEDSTPSTKKEDWKQIAIIGGMILASVFLVRIISA